MRGARSASKCIAAGNAISSWPNFSTLAFEKLYDLSVTAASCDVPARLTVPVLNGHVGAMSQEKLNYLRVAVERRLMQRRFSSIVLCMDLGAVGEKEPDNTFAPVLSGQKHRCGSILTAFQVDICSACDEQPGNVAFTVLGGVMKRRAQGAHMPDPPE